MRALHRMKALRFRDSGAVERSPKLGVLQEGKQAWLAEEM